MPHSWYANDKKANVGRNQLAAALKGTEQVLLSCVRAEMKAPPRAQLLPARADPRSVADGPSRERDYAARLPVRAPVARFCWLRCLSSPMSPVSTIKPAFSAAEILAK
jgi:hypothetical protein